MSFTISRKNTHLGHALHITFKCAMRMRIVEISRVTVRFYKLWVRCNAPDAHSAPRMCRRHYHLQLLVLHIKCHRRPLSQRARRIVKKKARYQERRIKRWQRQWRTEKWITRWECTRAETIPIRKIYRIVTIFNLSKVMCVCVILILTRFQNGLTSLSQDDLYNIMQNINLHT